MNQVLRVYKPIGLTPLQMLDRLRIEQPKLKDVKLSYAGRLDPMAEGVMLVLVGEANKGREKYLALDKEYEFEMVIGIGTDSYDLLGLVTQIQKDIKVDENKLRQILESFKGKQTLPYPPYSSRPVDGKPLWWWAREGRLDEIEIPENTFVVYEIELLEIGTISASELLTSAIERIRLVEGDFRQEEIVDRWKNELSKTKAKFPLVQYRIKCSSGTYVRSIVNEIGAKMRNMAVTYSIKRTWIEGL